MLGCGALFVLGTFSFLIILFTGSFLPLIASIFFFLLPQKIMAIKKLKRYSIIMGTFLFLLSCVIFSLSLNVDNAIYAITLFFTDVASIIGILNRYIILKKKQKGENIDVRSLTIDNIAITLVTLFIVNFFL